MSQRIEDLLDQTMGEEQKSTVAQKGGKKLTLGVSNNGVTFSTGEFWQVNIF